MFNLSLFIFIFNVKYEEKGEKEMYRRAMMLDNEWKIEQQKGTALKFENCKGGYLSGLSNYRLQIEGKGTKEGVNLFDKNNLWQAGDQDSASIKQWKYIEEFDEEGKLIEEYFQGGGVWNAAWRNGKGYIETPGNYLVFDMGTGEKEITISFDPATIKEELEYDVEKDGAQLFIYTAGDIVPNEWYPNGNISSLETYSQIETNKALNFYNESERKSFTFTTKSRYVCLQLCNIVKCFGTSVKDTIEKKLPGIKNLQVELGSQATEYKEFGPCVKKNTKIKCCGKNLFNPKDSVHYWWWREPDYSSELTQEEEASGFEIYKRSRCWGAMYNIGYYEMGEILIFSCYAKAENKSATSQEDNSTEETKTNPIKCEIVSIFNGEEDNPKVEALTETSFLATEEWQRYYCVFKVKESSILYFGVQAVDENVNTATPHPELDNQYICLSRLQLEYGYKDLESFNFPTEYEAFKNQNLTIPINLYEGEKYFPLAQSICFKNNDTWSVPTSYFIVRESFKTDYPFDKIAYFGKLNIIQYLYDNDTLPANMSMGHLVRTIF